MRRQLQLEKVWSSAREEQQREARCIYSIFKSLIQFVEIRPIDVAWKKQSCVEIVASAESLIYSKQKIYLNKFLGIND